MLLTNWLKTLTSRLRKRPVFRSRDRRALRRYWQTVLSNQISTVEVLEDRTMLTTITGASPDNTGTLNLDATSLKVTFSETVEGADVAANYVLVRAGVDGLLGSADDVVITVDSTSYNNDTNTAKLYFAALSEDIYRLTVLDTITDVAGNALDGDGDGSFGGEYLTDFVVGATSTGLNSPEGYTLDPESLGFGAGQLVQGSNGAFDGLNRLQVGGIDYAPSMADYQVSATLQESTSTASQSLDYRYLVIGTLTVDESGVYEISGEIGIRSLSSSASQVQYGLVINDEFGESRVSTIPNGLYDKSFELNLEETLELSAGDSVQLWVRENAGSVRLSTSASTPLHRLGLTRLEGISGISVAESTTTSFQSLSSSFVTVETLTAAESGVYRVTGEIGVRNYTTSTSQLEYRILVNGSQRESRIFNISDNLSSKYFELNLADTVELSAGDRVHLEVREISGNVYLSNSSFIPRHRLRLIRYEGVSGITTQESGSSDSSILTTSFQTVGTLSAAQSGAYRLTGEIGVENLLVWEVTGYNPRTGQYYYSFSYYDSQVEYRFLINGAVSENRITTIPQVFGSQAFELNLEQAIELSAGDTVQLQVRKISGSATLSTSDYTPQHKLSLTRLGDVPMAMHWEGEGRTVVSNVQSLSGLDVHREITVPNTGYQDFARTIDVFHNPTASAITETVRIVGNLGSDRETIVFNTSDGDTIVEPTDLWIGTDDADGSGTPALIHYIHSVRGLVPATVEVVGDNIVWAYNLTVNAGETVRLAHFTILDENRADAEAAANALVTSAGFSGEAAMFLTEAELASLQNFQFDQPPFVSASVSQVETAENGLDSYSFTVEFSDDSAIDISTIDVNDVTVTGPHDTLVVTSAVVHSGVDGSPVSVTYTVTPPGGFWDLTDNGTYSIQLNGSEVGDDGSIQLFVAENSSLATFEVDIPSIISQGELLPDPAANPAEGDETGSAVAVDGDWMVVAAASYNNRDGVVYLYVRNDVNQTPDNLTDDTWDFHSTIYAPTDGVELGYYDFGRSVAIDGDTLIIAAPYADDGDLAGSVYLYQLNEGANPGHEDDAWVHQQTFTQPADGLFGDPFPRGFGPSVSNFGHSLAMQGQTIVVGAPNADVDETTKRAGAVYVFMSDDGWNTYSTRKLTASDATDFAFLGESVAISEDENTIIAGDPYHNSDGAVYLFSRDTSGTASPGDDSWSEIKMLTAFETGSHFGTSVGIENGIAVIGAIGDAYLIQESDNWDVLKSLAVIGETKPDRFGLGVAISGDVILVGGPDSGDPADPGSVYLYDGWNGWESPDVAQLYALDPNLNETSFTESIAISGRTIIAGWRNHAHDGVQTGVAYAYEYQPIIDLKADLIDGSLVFNSLTNQNAAVSLSVSDGALVVTHPNNRLVPPVEGNQVNLNQFTIPLSALITREIYINGGTGDDRVSVDASLAAVGLKVIFNGGEGGGFDSLDVTGIAGSAEYLFENEHDGKVQINDSGLDLISYTGLETITSSIDAPQVTLVYSDADETITVSSPASGQLSVDSTAGEIITFQDFTGKLTLDAGAGINTLNLNDLGASLTADFEILDSAGTETVVLGDTLNLGSGAFTIYGETVQIAGAVTGAGDLEIVATTIEFANTNSSLNTGDGDLRLLAENTIELREVSTTGTVEITSLTGDITDNNDSANNIAASRAILSAVNGRIGYTLETAVGNLEAVAVGDIDITNTGDLIIGGVSELEGIESTSGRVIVLSLGSIEVQEDVSSYANLGLRTLDSEIASLDEDILVHSGVTLQSETGYVGLYSDDDVTVQEQALLQTTAHNIYFYVNYDSADGLGGVLDLAGELITQNPSYSTQVYGSPQADLYQIAPSLNSRVIVRGYIPWSQTETLEDELIYSVPEGESATLVPSDDVNGRVLFTGGFKDIIYNFVETLQQDDLQQQAGHIRVTGTAGDDVLTINAISANSGTWQLNDGPINSFSDIENFTFLGLEGDDRLVINNPVDGVFQPPAGVDYIGGTGGETLGDSLEIIGGFVADSEFEFLTEDRGRVFYGGLAVPAINYFDLEELVSELSVTEQQLYYNIPATLLSISDAGAGKTAFDTAYGTPLKLETPIETLSLQYGNRPLQGDQYYIHLNSLGAGFDANFVINDRHNNNTVILTDGLYLDSADVTINTGRVRVFGSVTGTGDLEIVTATIDFPYANSMLNTGAGDFRLQAETTINLTEVISTGTVEITSLNGDITDGNDSLNNIKASQAILSAVNGSIGNTLETEMGRLEAVADGSIEISNTGDLILGGIGVLDGVESTGGDVIVETQGRLEVHENVTAHNGVSLTTLDSAVASLNEDIVVKSGVAIHAANDEVALYADDDLTVEELAEILAPAYYISLNVNYDSADGVGGVLDLSGQTTTWGPFYRTSVYGSSQADSFRIAPSLNSHISVLADSPASPDLITDSLSYITPEGETVTVIPSGDTFGKISFTGDYDDIQYSGVETLQQADLQLLANQLRVEGTAGDDVLTINAIDANSGTWQLNDGPAVAFSGIDELAFYGLTGDDRLLINNPAGMIFNPANGIVYDAGGQAGDELELTGGTVQSVQHQLNEGQNAIYFNGSVGPTVRYLGVGTVIVDTDAVATTVVGDSLTVSSDDGVQTRVTGNTGVLFTSYSGLLAVEGTSASATLQLNSLGSGVSGTLLIGGNQQETVILNDGLNLGSADLTIHAGSAQVTGKVTGSGDLQIEATMITFADENSGIDAGAGGIELISSEDLIVGNLTTTGTVVLTSLTGDIRRVTTGASLIKAFSAVMSAEQGNVGYSNQLYTELSRLEVIAFDGVAIRNTGDLTIGGISDLVGIETLAGGISVYNYGKLQVSEDLISLGGVALYTLDIDNPSADRNLIVDSGVFLQSGSGMSLVSCDDLLIEQNALLTSYRVYLNVDVGGGDDTSGGRLDLLGELAVFWGEQARIYGGAQADSFYINPSQRNRIYLDANDPTSPADTLYYYTPEGVTATLSSSSTNVGTVTFSGGYQEILHVDVENIENAGTPPAPDPTWISVAGTSGNDVLTVNATDSNSGTWQLNAGPVVSFDDIESFTFFGLEGDDRLVINNPVDGVFHPAGGINYGGGTGGETLGDSLQIIGGTIEDSEFQFIDYNRGRVFYGGMAASAINHVNLEELSSELSVTNQRIYYSFPGPRPLSISDAGAGMTAFDPDYATPLKLISPIETLSLQYGNQPLNDYQINLNSLGAGFSADLIIDDRDDNTSITLGDGLNMGSGNVSISAETVQIAGSVSGEGDLDVVATTIEFPNPNSSLNTGDGNLNLLAENSITLQEVISTGDVEITSLTGGIYDGNGSANNITASRAILSAENGAISSLETEVGNLEAVAYGNIDITNTGDLIIGGVSELKGVESTYGRVIVQSVGSMKVEENVSAYERLTLLTQDSSVASLDEDILVHSGVTLQSETDYVALFSADDLTVEEQATLEALGTHIYLHVNYQSTDGVGGVLNLVGNLKILDPIYRAVIVGSPQADAFLIAPSQNSVIVVYGDNPAAPDLIADTLIYLTPDRETATLTPSNVSNGIILFSGSYQYIDFTSIETVQEGDLAQLAGQLRIDGTAGDDVLTINATDVNSGTWQLNDGPAVAFSAIDELAFYGLTGDDRLVINHPEGMIFNPVGGILYDAGGQADDELELTGGFATSEEHRLVAGQHAVYFNESIEATIRHLGVSRVLSKLDTAETILTGDNLTVSSDDGIQTHVTGANTSVVFESFTGTLSVAGDTGAASIQLNSLGSGLTGTFQAGSEKQETVILNDGLDLGSGEVSIQAGIVQIAGAVTREGDLDISASTIDFTDLNSSLDTGAGDLSLQAERSIYLGHVLTTGTVDITTIEGDIIDNNGSATNISASKAILDAEYEGEILSLETEIGYLEAVARGSIEIINTGDLVIGGVSDLQGIQSFDEWVSVQTMGGMQVGENVRAFDFVVLWTQDSASASLSEDIQVKSDVIISTQFNSITLNAADDLKIEEQARLWSETEINLRVNYDSTDGVGGILDLIGQVNTSGSNYVTNITGSSQADSFRVTPSQGALIEIEGNEPASPGLVGDTLFYMVPEGETATQNSTSESQGSISYTGGYDNIQYSDIEILEQSNPDQLARKLRFEGTAADDVLTINATNENAGTWQLNAGPEVAFSDIDELVFYGLTGDDRLVINHPDGAIFNPTGGILYDAGGQAGDELELAGGTVQSVQHRLDEGQNAIYFNGSVDPTVRYQGLGTVIADTDAVATTVVGESLTVSSDDGVQTRVTGNTGVLFTSYSGLLAVEGTSPSATIQLNSLGSGMLGTLLIGGNQQETVILNDGLNLGSADLTIRAGSAQVTGEVTRSGDLQIEANTITFADANSGIDAGAGNIELISSEDLIVGNLTTTGTVVLTSLNGDIRRVTTGASLIKAYSAVMSAEQGNVGYSNQLYTELSRLEVIAYDGGAISNTGDLTIGGISDLVGIETLAGGISVYNYGNLQVSEDLISLGGITLSTLDFDNPSADRNLIVNSGVYLQGGSSISLRSCDDLLIEQNALLTSFSVYLNVDVGGGDDASGGRLDLLGELTVFGGSYAGIYGGAQADSFYISPSQRNRIYLDANDPTSPADTLYYYTPEGVTAMLSSSSTTVGTVTFSGGYQEILHVDVETIENAGTPPEPDPAWISVAGTSGNDVLTVNATDSNSGTWQLNAGPVVSFDDIESFTFFGLEGDDRLVIHNPVDGVFHPAGGINYGGGTGGETLGDTLEIIGGVIEDSEFEFVADNRGRIFYGNGAAPAINHFNLEELSSELSVTNQQIYYSFPGTQPLTISDAGAGVTAFDCVFGTPLKLISPIETLTLQFGNQPLNDYQINLNSLGAGFAADLIINDRDKNTSITLGDGLNLGSGDVSIDAETVQVAGTVTGEGDLDVVATTIEFPNPNSSLNTGDGDLRLLTESSITLKEVISKGDVEITSLTGGIYDGNGSANNITASRAILSAENDAVLGLETELGNLEVVAYSYIDLTNTGDLIIGGISELEGIESTYGRVIVRSLGSMQVKENVSSYTNLLLWTQDSSVASLDEDILVHSGVRLHSETNYVALYSDDDLIIEEQVTLETLSSNIYLRVNYQSADGVGGVLNLDGNLVTQSPSYRAYLYGSTQADTFWITPSLNSHIGVLADSPANPDLIGDTLNYLLPEGVILAQVPSSDANGTLTFTGDYKDIIYNNVETLQQGDPAQLSGQLKIVGTAGDDVLTINATDANSGTWQLNSGPEVAFSSIDELVFYGLMGDDRLLINNPDGMIFNPANGVLYDAGGQAGDVLELQGGYATSEEHRLVAGQNAVYFNGASEATIRYLGVPTIVSEMGTAETTLTGDSLTVSSDDGIQTRVTGNASVLVGSFTGTLAVVGDTEAATIQLNSLGSGMTGTLQVGRDRQEAVILNNGLDLGGAKLIVDAGEVSVAGDVSSTSDVTIHGSTISFTDWDYEIDAGAGTIELQSDGRIIVGGLRTTGDVKVTTHDGDIQGGGASNSFTAASAVLISEKAAIRSLRTEIGFLEAYAYYGVDLINLTDLTVGGISELVGINSLAGAVSVRTYGGLTVKEDIRSSDIRLYTMEAVDNASADHNLVIESGVVLQASDYASIQLYSSDDLTLEHNSLLSGGDIHLRVGTSALDGEGGRLDLRGQLVERNDLVNIFGGTLSDSFYIYPGLENQIWIAGGAPGTETSPGDTIYYYTPEGVTGTDTAGSTTGSGVISYSDGFQNIEYYEIETVINAGVPPVVDNAHLQLTGTTGDDVLTINATGAASGTWQLNDGQVNPFADIESLTFFGLSGDDQLVINHPVDGVFQPGSGINFVGGSEGETLGDTLEIVGGNSLEAQMEFLFEGVGTVYYEGITTPAIRYFDLEEVRNQGTVENLKLNYRSINSQTLTVNDAGSGLTSIDSNYGTLLTFSSPSEALSVSVESHPNYDPLMTLNSMGEGFHADVTILNDNQNLNVMLGDGLNLGSGEITIYGETVQIAGAVSGAGDLDIVAITIDFPNTNSSLNTGDGDLRLLAENTIELMEVISSGTVEITSKTGDIANGTDSVNIRASRAILSAVNGLIGDFLRTEVGTLEAVAYGIIDITNTGDLIIGGVSGLEGVESTNERVSVRSVGSLEVLENVSAHKSLLLWSFDSSVASPDEDILVHSGVTLQSETGYVALYSDDDVTIQEQALLQTTAHNIYFQINYDSADGLGGVLDLAGELITLGSSYRTFVYGNSQADLYKIVPSLSSQITVQGYHWSQTETLDDELIYYVPQGEVATHTVSGTDQGQISFSGSYQDITYIGVHTHVLAGSLTLKGTAGDDVLTINATGANSGTFQFNDEPVVVFTELSDLTFLGLEGDDRLVINHPSEGLFAPLGGVLFEGGGQSTEDMLEIYGGTATSVEHRFINENDGSIFYNGQTTAAITYTGLEPVLDTIAAIDRSFSFTGDAETITLSDDGDTGDGETQIDSTLGELVVFTNPTGTLTINTEVFGGTGSDTIIVNPVDSTFTANLTINAGNDDSVTLNTIDSGPGNVELNANEINIDGTLTTSGMVAIQADSLIRFAETGVIDATANTVQLTAGLAIQLGKIITAGDVWLISTGGAILDNSSSENTLIQSDSLFLQTVTGIGGAGDADIDIEANHITVDSYQGPIMIDNFGDLFIQLSDFPNLILNEDAGEQTIPLSLITTAGGTSQPLSVTATSSQPSLIPNPQINYLAGDTTDSLVFTPAPEQTGTATITLVITDGGADHLLETTGDNRSIELTFDITVSPQNDDPELDHLDDLLLWTNAHEQTVVLSGITAGGGEVQPLRVTAESNNPGLIANPVVNYSSADATGSLSFTPVADQTGTATITVIVEDGGLDGDLETTADNATLTRTFVVTVRELETVSLRVMNNPTVTDANGETESLSAEVEWLGEWDSYWLELWVSTEDLNSQGIASVSLDLAYLTDLTSATGIEFGAAFSQNQSGTINDEDGLVEGLSATTDLTDLGINTLLLFARIRFESLAEDNVLLDLEGQRIGPHDLGFQIQNSQIGLGSERVSQNANVDHSAAVIWANPYDLNDDDQIGFRDLLLFASVYNSFTAESSSQYAWFSDFNRSGRVAFRDLILLATNYNKSKVQQQEVIYPNNYPQDWDQQLQVSSLLDAPQSTKILTQDQAQTALQSAVDDMRPKLSEEGQQKLAQVQVEVVDLSGNTLGRVEGDTIYLDASAAGYGWFVDQTPWDHSEFQYDSQLSLIALPDSEAAGLIDLWTVIRHELGHLLGYEHQEEGLMEAVLDPGERKLADWSEESDDFFASLKDDNGFLVF
ncbi:hypothetical protein F1728_04755 [Gimesia benthica]|uniref:SbsA Ig-like domain-containing protein n=1 Tax=Gimesia benthica TaxID=2608982 RepID=A0A6I6A6K4_9PLAN|nr:Ig-like domain-containing protein [Gimesia benthica]QGQ22044.1 hypothetical protein F1728_04755 [Gimesia benthica]